ncbi:unnamed protein product, partial [Brassica rapa subsp. trilocularis]
DVGFALLLRLLYPLPCLSSGSGPFRGKSVFGVDASFDPPSSVLFPGGEGFLSLASPALVVVHGFVLSDELSIGSMKLSEGKTKHGREELVSMEAFRYGGGQVETEETRVVLMGSYPPTRPASLTRRPTKVGRIWFGP